MTPVSRPAPGVATGVALWRIPLLAAGMLSLVVGVLAGLARGGLAMPIVQPVHVAMHGPLMIGAFLGTVICLERAVAYGSRPAFVVPALSALSAVALWHPDGSNLAAVLQFVAGVALAVISWRLHRRQPALHTQVLVVAAACWPLGALLWFASGDPGRAVVAWQAFLVLTIAAERLELSRFVPRGAAAVRGFLIGLTTCVAGAGLSAAHSLIGETVFAVGCALLAIWLGRHDVARRTATQPGLTGYIGRCLLLGYLWLGVGALLTLAAATALAPPMTRDAALHAVLLGFVLSMVFGHAPVIFPAVLRVRMPYHPLFYVPLVLLHASLVLRVGADLASLPGLRAAGAAGNALALLAFVVTAVSAVVAGSRAPARRS